MSGFVPGGQNR